MRRLFLTATMLVGFGSHAFANPSFIVWDSQIDSIGAEFPTIYDQLSIVGAFGTVGDYTASLADNRVIGSLQFNVGGNCYSCSSTPSGVIPINLQIEEVLHPLNLSWTWSSDGSTDRITFTQPEVYNFVLKDGDVVRTSFELIDRLASTGGTVQEDLVADLELPEPMSMAILGAGIAGIGVVRRKRNITA